MTPELVERTQRFLFASEEEMTEARLPQPVRERLVRLRDMYAYWMRHPQYADKAIVAQLRLQYGIGFSQAYDDVRLLKVCLGNLGQVTRQWCQYLFLQRCEEGFEMARRKNDASAYARVLAALGKFTRLDHDESIGPDYSQIVPQQFEITSDPSVAGFERIPNVTDRARRLFDRFRREGEQATAPPVVIQEPQQPTAHAAAHRPD